MSWLHLKRVHTLTPMAVIWNKQGLAKDRNILDFGPPKILSYTDKHSWLTRRYVKTFIVSCHYRSADNSSQSQHSFNKQPILTFLTYTSFESESCMVLYRIHTSTRRSAIHLWNIMKVRTKHSLNVLLWDAGRNCSDGFETHRLCMHPKRSNNKMYMSDLRNISRASNDQTVTFTNHLGCHTVS